MTWQRVLVLAGGLLLLLLSALVNPYSMTWLYAPDGEIGTSVRQQVQIVQLALFGLGITVLLARWELIRLLGHAHIDGAVRWVYALRPTLSAALPALPAPLLASLCWAVVVQRKEHFPLDHLLPWLVGLQAAAIDICWFVAVGLAARRAHRLLALVWIVAWVGLRGLDVLSMWHGHSRFEPDYLRFVRTESLLGFFDTSGVGLLLMLLGLGGLALWGLERARGIAWRWALVGTLLSVFPPVDALVAVWQLPMNDYVLREVSSSMKRRLDYVAEHPVHNLAEQLLPALPTPAVSEATLLRVASEHHLALGPRDYPPLTVEPFSRVVLLLSESVSLDLTAPYNPTLPTELTPLYAELAPRMARAHHTAATPTLNGTTALVTSHPNAPLMRELGYPHSLVDRFAEHGFATVSLRADSRFFYNNYVENERMGYARSLNREDLEARGATCQNRWGVCDRVVYRELLDLLDTEERLFVTVIGVDTHPLTGRQDHEYVPLVYPPTPEVPEVGSRGQALYESIYRHDHDVRWFLDQLEARGLWDERTLVVLTADHASPLNNLVQGLPGYPQDPLARMPLAWLSPQDLPAVDLLRPSSTLDIAPSLMHLMGWEVPQAWWGDSVFQPGRESPAVGRFRDTLYLWSEDGTHTVDLRGGDELAELFHAEWPGR